MENPNVKSIYGILSDILEQGMSNKDARKEYKERLTELKKNRDVIGKPYKVLAAFIFDEYSRKDLEHFMASED